MNKNKRMKELFIRELEMGGAGGQNNLNGFPNLKLTTLMGGGEEDTSSYTTLTIGEESTPLSTCVVGEESSIG